MIQFLETIKKIRAPVAVGRKRVAQTLFEPALGQAHHTGKKRRVTRTAGRGHVHFRQARRVASGLAEALNEAGQQRPAADHHNAGFQLVGNTELAQDTLDILQ